MATFPQILEQCLSTDRLLREAGESALTVFLQQAPDQAAQCLAGTVSSGNEVTSTLAAVLFRRKLLEEGVLKSLSQDVKTNIKNALLQAPTPNSSAHHLRQIADVLVNFAESEGWGAELMRHMGHWIQDATYAMKEFTLYLFELCTDTTMASILQANSDAVVVLLTAKLADSDTGIQLSAVKTAASFLSILEDERSVMSYQALGPMLLGALTRGLQEEPLREAKMREALTNLADLIENYPKFWRNCAEEFCRVMTTLAKSGFFSKELRGAATEVLSTFLLKAPQVVKKSVFFTQELIVLGFTLTSELPPVTLEDWILDEEQSTVVVNEPQSLGKDLLSRLATCLGPATVMSHFQQLIPLHLRAEDWVKQHTGLLAIGMIAEGCHKSFEHSLGDILTMILPFMSSANQRLVWAATTTLGLLCSEFEPELEYEQHAVVLPALLRNFSHSCIKVQTQTVNALINFTRGLLVDDEETAAQYVLPYAGGLMDGLLKLLQTGLEQTYTPLLAKVLEAISALASVMRTHFAQYYNTFIPGLRTIVAMPAVTEAQMEIRAECIKALGYMISSLSDAGEAFVEDARAILASLIQQRAQMADNDPSIQALESMSPYFAEVLRERFSDFLPSLVPSLLHRAETFVSIAFVDANSPEAAYLSECFTSCKIEMRGHGTKRLVVDSPAMETKTEACKNIYGLANALKTVYSPMVIPTFATVLPLMDWNYSGVVRKYCAKTVAACVEAADTQEMKQGLLRQVFPAFKAQLESKIEAHLSDTKNILKSLVRALESVTFVSVIGLPAAIDMSNVLAAGLNHVFRRKMERSLQLKQAENDGISDEEREEIDEDERTDDEIIRLTMEIVGAMLKAFRSDFQAPFKQLFQNFYDAIFAKQNPSDVEVLSAICVFDDYVQHTKDVHAIGSRLPLLERILPYCSHRDASLRQSAAFGVGLFAEFSPAEIFRNYAQPAFDACSRLICDSRCDPHIEVTECAIGAIGKIALYHVPDYIDFWLTCLPLRSEPEEAQTINKLFLANLPRFAHIAEKAKCVIAQLKEIVKTKPDVLDEDGNRLLLASGL